MYQNGERTRGRTPLGVDVIRRRTPNHVRTVPTHRRSGCNGDLTSNSDAERVGKSQAGVSILAAQIRLFFIHRYPPNGEGVLQDDVEAVAWYRRAAEQGESGARRCVHRGRAGCPWLHVQHRPGRTAGRRRSGGVVSQSGGARVCGSTGKPWAMYYAGQGVPQDYVSKDGWFFHRTSVRNLPDRHRTDIPPPFRGGVRSTLSRYALTLNCLLLWRKGWLRVIS